MKRTITIILAAMMLCALFGNATAEINADTFKGSPLLQLHGNEWAIIGNFSCQDYTLDATIYLKSLSASMESMADSNTPYIMLYLGTTSPTSEADVVWDTINTFRVTVDGTCYAFNLVRMSDNGDYGLIRCGETARAMLSALASSSQASFEADYTGGRTGENGTFTITLSASDYEQWIEFGQLLENCDYWDTLSGTALLRSDVSTSISQQ